MKTSVIEVHAMLSVLSVDEVEERIGAVPGVESVTVNFAAGNATTRYDETRLAVADIKSAVRQRGHESAAPAAASAGAGHEGHTGPGAPAPIPAVVAPKTAPVAPSGPKAAGSAGAGHDGHTAPGAPPANPAAVSPKPSPVAAGDASAGTAQQDKAAPDKS